MQPLTKSRLLRFGEEAFQLAQRAVARYSSKFSKQHYTRHQHIDVLCLKVRKDTTYRTLLDELIEMPRIQNAINLTERPGPSTCVKRSMDSIWRFGGASQSLCFTPSDQRCCGDRCFEFDRNHASKHYTKRAKLTIQPTESHTLSRYESKRDPQSPRYNEPQARYTDRTVTHQPQHRRS